MDENDHSALVSISILIVRALESYGLDYEPIVEEAGFDRKKNYLSNERLPVRKIKKLWDLSVKYTQDPCFGLTYAHYIQPSALHGLGFSWLASHTLKDGLVRLVRFQKILGTELTLKLRETDVGYCLYESIPQQEDPFHFCDASYNAGIASIYKICQIMMGTDFKPIRVSFEHKKPFCSERLDHFFNIAVNFDANETAIEFDKVLCERVLVSENPDLARLNDQIVIDYLKDFEQDNIITKTRKILIEQLPSGLPKQFVVAKVLNLSLRNFQRQLTASDTCYSEVLKNLRYELACRYLSSPKYQITEIAFFLGFSDPSNFGRAFKRWNGLSPSQYREKLN